MLSLVRRLISALLFGSTEQTSAVPLTADHHFLIEQHKMGLISEGEWQDHLARDPVLAFHFKFGATA